MLRQATPPKRTDPSDILQNHIYDIDEQDDALSNEMCDHGSYDNDILNERIRATLPNGVSGVVGSPTRIDDIDTAVMLKTLQCQMLAMVEPVAMLRSLQCQTHPFI